MTINWQYIKDVTAGVIKPVHRYKKPRYDHYNRVYVVERDDGLLHSFDVSDKKEADEFYVDEMKKFHEVFPEDGLQKKCN